MATTSPDNLWSPDPGNNYNLTVDLAAMQASVQAALTATNTSVSDLRTSVNSRTTSSLAPNLTLVSGVSGAVRIRRWGGFVEIGIDISNLSPALAANGSINVSSDLIPAEFRPLIHTRTAPIYAGGNLLAFATVGTTGEVVIRNPPGNPTIAVARGSVTYWIGNGGLV